MKQLRNKRTLPGGKQAGFTMVELMVTVVVVSLIAGAAFLVLNDSAKAKRVGDDSAEAQQNGRSAMNAILDDLRATGYGIDEVTAVPVEVASEFRITLRADMDRDGVLDDGERVTYFLDQDQTQSLARDTANPYDYVIRRVTNDAANPTAAPSAGAGNAIAYMVSQRAADDSYYRDEPLFPNGERTIPRADPAASRQPDHKELR